MEREDVEATVWATDVPEKVEEKAAAEVAIAARKTVNRTTIVLALFLG